MNATLTTKTYIVCPACGKDESRIDHLFGDNDREFGPWTCGECGVQYSGLAGADNSVTVSVSDKPPRSKVIHLLVLEPQDKPVYFSVAMHDYNPEDRSGNRFYFEEHTCPTNWTHKIEMIEFGDDCDPHGLFKYVGTWPISRDFEYGDAAVSEVTDMIKANAGIELTETFGKRTNERR